jgi:predicted amidohydrolase
MIDITITEHFPLNAEDVPNGDTSKRLSECAKENKIFLVGGSIPEKEGRHLYNTCTVWNPQGQLLAKHRKVCTRSNPGAIREARIIISWRSLSRTFE